MKKQYRTPEITTVVMASESILAGSGYTEKTTDIETQDGGMLRAPRSSSFLDGDGLSEE